MGTLTLLSALTHLQDGRTALIIAAQEGHTDIVKLLLQHGADIDHATKVIWERNERVEKCLRGECGVVGACWLFMLGLTGWRQIEAMEGSGLGYSNATVATHLLCM